MAIDDGSRAGRISSRSGPFVTNIRLPIIAAALAFLLGASLDPVHAGAADAAPSAAAIKETRWADLVPKDWDPAKQFRDANIGMLNDGSPKMVQLMRELREAWDNAPTNREMDGAAVKLPGYIVPLEEVKGELKEFLLVPYFGACIHTPPPPANQIVHVVAAEPLPGLRTMAAVWVTGTLTAQRQNSVMGMSGYQIRGATIEPYRGPRSP